jgi:hypothetical protein
MSDDRADAEQSRNKRLKISDSAVTNGNGSAPAVLRAGRSAAETGSAVTTATAAAFHSAAPQFAAAAANGDANREVKLNPKMSKLLSTSAKR